MPQDEVTLLRGERRILEMVATGAPLRETLEALAALIESQEPGMTCGILAIAMDGPYFDASYGPNLPDSYHDALVGLPITPAYIGACGEVAHKGLPIQLRDIAASGRYTESWRQLLSSIGKMSMASFPISTSVGEVLGTLAIYYHDLRDPRPADPRLIEIATHLACIALERDRSWKLAAGRDEQLEANAKQFADLIENAPFGTYIVDADFRLAQASRSARAAFGNPDLIGTDLAEALRKVWPDVFANEVIGRFRQTLATGEPFVERNTVEQRADVDAVAAYDWRIDRILMPDGRFGVVCYFYDFSERQRMEAELRASEARFASAFDQAPSFMAMLSGPEYVIEIANPNYMKLVGRCDVVGRKVADALPEAVAQGYIDLLDHVYSTGTTYAANGARFDVQPAPGGPIQERFVDFVYQPIADASGTVTRIFLEGFDVTDRVRAEAALRESEDKFRAFAEAVPNQVWSAYPDGRLEWLNARLYEYLGSDAIDPNSLRWDGAVHPDDFAVADPAWPRAVATGTVYHSEYRLRRYDGMYRWHLTRAVPIHNEAGEIKRWIGTNTDIDDNKAIAHSLTDLNRSLEQQVAMRTADRNRLWENSHDILVVTDAEGVYRAVSPAWTKVLGHEPAEVIGRSYLNFIHTQDVQMVLSAQEAGALGQPFTGFVTRHEHKNGESRWVAWSSANDNGLIYATGRDITAERMARAELSQAQARIRTIFETTVQFQAYLSPDGILLDVNPAGLAMISAKRTDVIGQYFWNTTWFAHTPDLADDIRSAVAKARDGGSFQREIAIKSPTIGVRYCDLSIRPVSDAQDTVVGIIFESVDLTDRRIAEQQLHQAQKMEAVGHLTGGLAHDFNNMLAIVISALQLLESRGGPVNDQSRRFIDAAKDAAFRASTLTRRLLEFSRQQPHAPVIVNVNTIIASMVTLLQHSVGDRIRLSTRLAQDLSPTYADTNQLENIVLNLVVNARDAMRGEGDLIISTANVTLTEGANFAADANSLAPGDYVTIAVTDTGSGMSPEVVERAFEPFFSTKGPGKGTGLGLSQVYGFVKRFGGDVRIDTELARGTTITLYLRSAESAERLS